MAAERVRVAQARVTPLLLPLLAIKAMLPGAMNGVRPPAAVFGIALVGRQAAKKK